MQAHPATAKETAMTGIQALLSHLTLEDKASLCSGRISGI
jgi:hypothetical protein